MVVGEEFKNERTCFTRARTKLAKHILQFGYIDSFDEYAKWLWKADILPVTSNQDFFGASIMEAVYCDTTPILPTRLTYPNLFHEDENPEIFYQSTNDLIHKLENILCNYSIFKSINYQNIAKNYDWSIMATKYDDILENLKNDI